MSDQRLLETVRRADPVSGVIGEPPDALFERVLATARAEAQRPSEAERQWHQHRSLSRWSVAVGAVAAVALVAVVVTALLPAGDTGAPSPAAAGVLLHAARAAARQPATGPPAPGQFVYTKSKGVFGSTTAPVGGQAFNTLQPYTRQQWIGPDGSGRILQVAGTPQLVTSADRAAWVADGKPNLADSTGNIDVTQRSGLYYLDLSNVPTDPAALKQLIEQRKLESGPPGDAETFTIIGDLLRDSYAPPAVRSALYAVAAQLPGIKLIGTTQDQLGRSGTTVGYTSSGNTQELILDPQTSALLAEQTIDNTGTVVDWTAYLSSGIVNSTSAAASDTP